MKRKVLGFTSLVLSSLFLLGSCSFDKDDNDNISGGASVGNSNSSVGEKVDSMYIYVNDVKLEVELEGNKACSELVNRLNKSDVSVSMTRNGGFEQYGDLGFSLPTNNTTLTSQCGDVYLYNSRYICLFYSESTWSYTKLGRITNKSNSEIVSLLSNEDVDIVLSLG